MTYAIHFSYFYCISVLKVFHNIRNEVKIKEWEIQWTNSVCVVQVSGAELQGLAGTCRNMLFDSHFPYAITIFLLFSFSPGILLFWGYHS